MDEAEAKKREEEDGWIVVEDAGRGWRRVVPSPKPLDIVEEPAIKALIDAGISVIAVGGGGIPVVEDDGVDKLVGVEAVIDKDFGSSLLANMLEADLFVISTAVEKVSLNFNTPDQKDIDEMTVAEAKQYIEEGHFAKGSMLPKVEAIIKFLENGGKKALITDPPNIGRALKGETGTWIVP
jgi:carbamate kinase